MQQCSQNVDVNGPHHRCFELIVSSSFNKTMSVERGRSHELVGSMVGAVYVHVLRTLLCSPVPAPSKGKHVTPEATKIDWGSEQVVCIITSQHLSLWELVHLCTPIHPTDRDLRIEVLFGFEVILSGFISFYVVLSTLGATLCWQIASRQLYRICSLKIEWQVLVNSPQGEKLGKPLSF